MSKIKIFALGGLNENGKNMYVLEIDKDIIVIDAGLKFADESMLGIDYLVPSIDYLKDNKKTTSITCYFIISLFVNYQTRKTIYLFITINTIRYTIFNINNIRIIFLYKIINIIL